MKKVSYLSITISVALLSGCTQVNKVFDNEGANYGDSDSVKSMEVPPDLTSPEFDSTFVVNPSSSTVGAGSLNRQASDPSAGGVSVLPDGDGLKISGTGDQRYLEVAAPAGTLWPRVTSFWSTAGATMKRNEPAVGIMETDWIEYREQLPQTGVTSLFRNILKNVGDSGFRDRYIIRFEKVSPQATRIFLTHRGAELMVTDTGNKWESRPASQEKAAEMLNRLRDYLLNGKSEKVYVSRDKPSTPGERKKLFGIFNVGEPNEEEVAAKPQVKTSGSAIRLPENSRSAFASVGGALTRAGFVIDGRDAAKGLYAVRWVRQDKQGLLDRINIFKSDKSSQLTAESKFVIRVVGHDDAGSLITVLDPKGQVKSDAEAQVVLGLLRKDLAR